MQQITDAINQVQSPNSIVGQFQRYELCAKSNHISHIQQIHTYTTQKSTKPKTAMCLMIYWASTARQTIDYDYDSMTTLQQTPLALKYPIEHDSDHGMIWKRYGITLSLTNCVSNPKSTRYY